MKGISMEPTETKKAATVKKVNSASSLRVKPETRKRIMAELAKINKKNFGRKIRPDQLLNLLLTLLKSEHIQKLQEESLSNSDRLEMQYREYIKRHGGISKDEFLGTLLTAESSKTQNQNAANSQAKNAPFSEEKVGS